MGRVARGGGALLAVPRSGTGTGERLEVGEDMNHKDLRVLGELLTMQRLGSARTCA